MLVYLGLDGCCCVGILDIGLIVLLSLELTLLVFAWVCFDDVLLLSVCFYSCVCVVWWVV